MSQVSASSGRERVLVVRILDVGFFGEIISFEYHSLWISVYFSSKNPENPCSRRVLTYKRDNRAVSCFTLGHPVGAGGIGRRPPITSGLVSSPCYRELGDSFCDMPTLP